MTVEKAESILEGMRSGVKIALRHRFAFDTGTMLRLDNYAMINIFDDGRYYIQGDDIEDLVIAFGLEEEAWDPNLWSGELPNHMPKPMSPQDLAKRPPMSDQNKRFEF